MDLLTFLLSAGGALLVLGLYKVFQFCYAQYNSPLRDLPGPESNSFFYGDLKEIWETDNSTIQEKWVEEYGSTIKYKGFLNMDRLFTMDTKALNHVLMNSNDYQKPAAARYNVSHILGKGLLVVEGDPHRWQRRIMNPAFGPTQIRALTAIFVAKATQLRDLWTSEIAKTGDKPLRIEVFSWLSKATLDIIGLAGFNYKFDALNIYGNSNELSDAFSAIFRSDSRLALLPMLRAIFPLLRILPRTTREKVKQCAKDNMTRIGHQIVRESRAVVAAANTQVGESGSVEKVFTQGRDLLSLLIRANMARDVPHSQRLSDEDVLAQVATFFVAGHETTSTATTWALFALTQTPEVQTKLRTELLAVASDNPTMDELNALPYLDAVVREVMRLHPPVPASLRVAMKDDVLPLNTPFVDKKGVLRDCIRIRKGDTILIPILAMNRSKSLWGMNAMEFKPERWESIPAAVNGIPGVWGNMLTFLGGPRSCIAYRFSLVEMKALLFILVLAFEFELAVPPESIVKKASIVQRPLVISDPNGGYQLPLLVRPYRDD